MICTEEDIYLRVITENSEKQRIRAFKKKLSHSFTLEDYKSMLDSQNSKCKICNNPLIKPKDIALDHCHKTGKVRGILCRYCNTGIGMLQDDTRILQNAIKYLKEFNNGN